MAGKVIRIESSSSTKRSLALSMNLPNQIASFRHTNGELDALF
jgi:hypothetical protein